jgi:hypothetical protein
MPDMEGEELCKSCCKAVMLEQASICLPQFFRPKLNLCLTNIGLLQVNKIKCYTGTACSSCINPPFILKNKKIRNRIGSKGGMTERRTKGNMNKGESRVEKNRKGEGTEGTYS